MSTVIYDSTGELSNNSVQASRSDCDRSNGVVEGKTHDRRLSFSLIAKADSAAENQ